MTGESIEQWAETVRFDGPVLLGEVEAAVLARPPAKSESQRFVQPILTVVAGGSLLVMFVLGVGVSLVGLLAAWLGTRDGASTAWLSVAQVVFVAGAFMELFVLGETVRSRRRSTVFVLSAGLTVVASAITFGVLRSGGEERTVLMIAVIAMGVLGAAVVLASLLMPGEGAAGPGPAAGHGRVPPRRGPHADSEYFQYKRTRDRVLDVLVRRGVVAVDEADHRRLKEMPLGYWEELDGVDEREWRRILEYRVHGWREFDASDERPWPPS